MPEAAIAPSTTGQHSSGYLDGAPAADAFQKLVDRGILSDPPKETKGLPEVTTPAPSIEAKVAQDAAPGAPVPAAEAAPEAPETPAEQEAYASLDDFLGKQSLDRESFYSLPVKVKVDGKEFDAPLAKLVESYQIGEYLAHKSNAFAEERRRFESDREQQRTQLAQQLQAAQHFTATAYQSLVGNPPTADQYPDAGQLALAQLQFNQRSQQLQQQYAQLQNVQTHVTAQTVEAERQRLLDAVPEWRDEAKFQEAGKQLASYAAARGFSQAELSQVTDHRYMLILHDAARARDLQAQVDTLKQQLEGKTSHALKLVRAAPAMASPGARTTSDPKVARLKQVREAARSGRLARNEDAQAAAFSALVEAGA